MGHEINQETGQEMQPKKEGWLGRWFKRLADASDREFRGKPPSCCRHSTHDGDRYDDCAKCPVPGDDKSRA